jgi:4-hydroxy-2-oxoheptanedioate aldolase
MMKMRRSRVLEKLRAGGVVSCLKINLESARSVEIGAMAGFDCIWVDTEHVASDWSVIEQQIWAAKSHDTDILVRVARGSYSDYIRPLELDASGIMVPHIMGVEDAKQVVKMTRFHPLGLRPVDGGNADGAYTGIDFVSYLQQANEQRFVIVQIEDPEALEEVEAIAQLEGIDMIFFGPGDFSHAIGAPGQWDDPRIGEARKRVADACRAHGKFAGTVGSLANLEELVALGYQFVNVGADVVSLLTYTSNLVSKFEEITSPTTVAESDASANGKGIY